MIRLLRVVFLLVPVLADYDCVCNYNVEESVFGAPSTGTPIGYLYEFDCKPEAGPDNGNFYTVMYEKQVAYIGKNAQVQVQTCPGEIPDEDKLTTVAGVTTIPPTTPSTPIPTTTFTTETTPTPSSTPKPTTVPSTTSTTTRVTTQKTTPMITTMDFTSTTASTLASTPSGVPEGHIEICPNYVKETDVNRYHGFLGQYGEFCYELVDVATQWVNAERHCSIVSTGHLAHVVNKEEQDFLVRFLSNHHYVQGVWLGLTDSGTGKDGQWRWTSGATFNYNNFQGEFNQHSATDHKNFDCIVLKQGGGWTDKPCGISFIFGAGAGEKHPYICQYNVSSSLPSIVQAFPNVVVG